MSLINDALKNAESMQPFSAPASPAAPVPPPVSAGTPLPLLPSAPAAPAPATPVAGTPTTSLKLSLGTPPAQIGTAASSPASAAPEAPAIPTPAPPPRLTLAPTVAIPPAAPPVPTPSPATVAAATAAHATTTPLRLNLSAPPPAPAPTPTPPSAATVPVAPAPIRLGATPATPPPAPVTPPALQPAAAGPVASSAPAAPTPPAPPPPPASASTSEPGSPTAPTLESLRLQYKKAGADDALASEKAIATAALEPHGLTFAIPAPETMAQAAAAAAAAKPPSPKTTPPPGAINPLSGLRVPTPELAAAFLASNPVPAGVAATAAPAVQPTASGATTAPDPREKIRNAPPPKGLSRRSANPESILLVVGGILAVLLGGGLTAAYLVFRDKPAPRAAEVAVEEESAEFSEPSESTTEDPTNIAPATGEPAATTETAATSAVPGDETAVAAPAPETAVTSPEASPTPAAEPTAPAPHVNRPNPTIQAWVQKIELTGIRERGPVSKVFMNGKLYDVGEVVNFDLNLKLTGVTGKVLHFEDAEGNTYEYRF